MRKIVSIIILTIYIFLLSYIYFLRFGFNIPRIIVIASSSMKPELESGDAVFLIKPKPEEIKIGDIISFNKVIPYISSNIITHRVIEIKKYENVYIFKTKADANPNPDKFDVSYKEIIGKVIFKIPKIGYALYFIKQNMLAISIILLGIGFIAIYKSY
ncbi:MAG: signal peptidase I [Candidatus Methanomethylicaceae archaeon]